MNEPKNNVSKDDPHKYIKNILMLGSIGAIVGIFTDLFLFPIIFKETEVNSLIPTILGGFISGVTAYIFLDC